ncbi:thioredoxin domain-containing protein [uncultured Thermanaerothrix sp.]|uniref:thioredoxin domain-containing protein n=1 Tax=uncultured Thermanaerothrix sp. TaxID=1195149 RepID=UPI0026293161|nr:thioredoxin domain-containing protein [uncultured Thermanaerothrix sp.]
MNRLQYSASPYLLQHANNPVDWYPWGEEAITKARREDKPIFLSIGYAACHWCHVMAHESFEDEQVAAFLNAHFVPIKVDREEHPDVDALYMNAVIAMTGQGGWPLSVFLTPSLEPFFGGTYFPPVPRHGLPSFLQVLQAVHYTWVSDRQSLQNLAGKVFKHLHQSHTWQPISQAISYETVLTAALNELERTYDWQHGGWGRAPKFPQPLAIEFLLTQASRGHAHAQNLAFHALHAMASGGIFDLVGGGFHRYSTDADWCIPHFEKMLYDNAQLATVYLQAYLLSKDETFRYIARRTLDFVLNELTHPAGGFYASLDADSEGEEGKFYTWSIEELKTLLGEVATWQDFSQTYCLDERVAHEGKLVLKVKSTWPELAQKQDRELAECLRHAVDLLHPLLLQRQRRVRPATDKKIIVTWNALTIRALALAGRHLGHLHYLKAAQNAANFILENLYWDHRLYRSWHEGVLGPLARLEDYASLILALLELYQTDFDNAWFVWASQLAHEMLDRFRDSAGGFFDSPQDDNSLPIRPKEIQDSATPSGNALAAHALLTLAYLDEHGEWEAMTHNLLTWIASACQRYPLGFASFLRCMDLALGPIQQLVFLWRDPGATALYLNHLHGQYRPRLILAGSTVPPASNAPALVRLNHPAPEVPVTAFICNNFICLRPTTSFAEFIAQI